MFNTKIALLALSMVVAIPAVAQAATDSAKWSPFACAAGEYKDPDGQCVPNPASSGSGSAPVHHERHRHDR